MAGVEVPNPGAVLAITLYVLLLELLWHKVWPSLHLWIATKKSDRDALRRVDDEMRELKKEKRKWNSPGTFSKFAKCERKLNKLAKRRAELAPKATVGKNELSIATVTSGQFSPGAMAMKLLAKGAMYLIAIAYFWHTPMFAIEATEDDWLLSKWSPLMWTPARRLLQSSVGVVPWLVITQRAVTWLSNRITSNE